MIETRAIFTSLLGQTSGLDNTYSTIFDGVDEFSYGGIVGGAYTTAVIRTFSLWVQINGGVNAPLFCGNATVIPAMSLFRSANGCGVKGANLVWALDVFWSGASVCRAVSEAVDGSGSAPNIYDRNWHHVAVYNPVDSSANRANITNAKIWLDGSPLSVTTDAGTAAVRGFTNNICLGCGNNGSWSGQMYLDGNIDEFAYWDKELSDAEVTELYNSGTPTDLDSFSGGVPDSWYRMGDDDTFPAIADVGSNSYNLTMYNMESGDFVTDVP